MTTETTRTDLISGSYILRLPSTGGSSQKISVWEIIIPSIVLLGAIPFAISSMLGVRCLMAGALFILFFTLRRSAALPIFALIYLAVLGGVRRNLIPLMGEFHVDPLLTVIPVVIGLIGFGKLLARQIPLDNPIAKTRALLLGLMLTVGLLNPMQGSVIVALGGAMFMVIPILWSFVGRDLGNRRTVQLLYAVALIVALFGAFYGIYQTLYGFTKGEQIWISRDPSYNSINDADAKRPMSFFTSTGEYPLFLAICFVIACAFILSGRFWTLAFPPLLLAGILYSGVRAPIVLSLMGLVVLWGVRGRSITSWIPRLALAAVLGITGLVYGIKHAQNLAMNSSQQALLNHQVEGISNPTDPNSSTAGIHAASALYGITSSLQHPIGIGLGAITLSGYQLHSSSAGPVVATNMEVDWSNMFLALGPVGGIVYLLFIGATLWCAFKVWHRTRALTTLAILGVLVTSLNTWLNGDNYSTCMLIWFSIGALEREYMLLQAQKTSSPKTASIASVSTSSST
ncbi:hypothetical protein CWRG_01319 [Chthonomonas calidirosea]|uniref:hypothetical protein n=1 Tax=Chthonomonas calidirosea TaxID=454171 RepID=UPI0006DD547E|nr:hypothetical protein [Chthonomonas calidirosea]CEK15932.1 hypothetical protein CWRG_01319 [Chthonomonas calidirosea]